VIESFELVALQCVFVVRVRRVLCFSLHGWRL
jgi:hypothetical protein